MFKHKFTKEKQIKDYEKTVELFNKTNTIKIGDNVNLVLQLFDNDMNITSSELIEVTVVLALYGVAEDEIGSREYKDMYIMSNTEIEAVIKASEYIFKAISNK